MGQGNGGPPPDTALGRFDDSRLRGVHWYWTFLAALADFLDAGSIVAGSAALTFWIPAFHLSNTTVGLVAAFSSNGISTGIGAWVGGRLGDVLGRKFIYSADLILYAIGALVIVFAIDAPMLIIGYILVGFAVGADIPTSWSLIAEFAPRKSRGKLMGLTNVFWYIGPIVMLLLSIGWAGLGILGGRLLFAVLFVVAIITWVLRRGLTESPRWSALMGRTAAVQKAESHLLEQRAAGTSGGTAGRAPDPSPPPATKPKERALALLTSRRSLIAFAIITPIYVLWGLAAGTYGFFLPHILESVGGRGTVAADGLDILWFGSAILTVIFVFMPLNDRVDRRLLYAISSAMLAVSFYMLIFFPISNPVVAIISILLFGLGQGVGLWPLQRIWSVEAFPTAVRNTAQGILWGFMRVILGLWSLYFPTFTAQAGFTVVAIVLGSFFVYNLVIGGIFGPRTQGRSLEHISA